MPFIGVIAKESESNFIKKEVTKNAKCKKLEVLNINKKNIENIKNIRFDVVVINDDIEDFFKTSKYLEDIIKKSKFLIVNSDMQEKENFLNMNKTIELAILKDSEIITYGLNQKATITMSSIKSENILICVQKNFKNYYGKIVEEQEVNVEITKNNLKKISNTMAIFTILTIFGEKLKKI